jgi:hypothetical protein
LEVNDLTAMGVWVIAWLSSMKSTPTASGFTSGTASGIEPLTSVTWLIWTRACALMSGTTPLGVMLPKNHEGAAWVIFTSTYFFVHGVPSL